MTKDVMIFLHLTTTPWSGGQVMSRQAMTRALSKYGLNLYVTPPKYFCWKTNSGDVHKKKDDNIIVLRPGCNKGPIHRYELLKKVQLNRQVFWLKKKIRFFRAQKHEPLVLYIWHYKFLPFVSLIPHDILVFHIYDDVFMYHNSNPSEEDRNAEQELINKADFLLVVTEEMARHKGISRPWIPCPGGVDISVFKKFKPDLKRFGLPESTERRKIGYFGRFNSKMNFNLLYEIVRKGKQYDFILAGMKGNLTAHDQSLWDKIIRQENVYYLGLRSQEELSHLYNALDVGFMPYHYQQGWLQYSEPLKLLEFWAVGKPVVSTPLASLKKYHDLDLISLRENADDFLTAFDREIRRDTPELQKKRMKFARENSWDARAKVLYAAIKQKLEKMGR